MRIAFIIRRSACYKFYGPIIVEALRRGWEVACWHDYGAPRTGVKSYLFPDLEKVPSFGSYIVDYRTYAGEDELRQLVAEAAVEAIISLLPKAKLFSSELPAISSRFVTLQSSGLDLFLYGSPTELGSSDLICLNSAFWLGWAREYFAAQGKAISQQFQSNVVPRVALTGFPELDVVSDIDPAEVRKRWNIPPQKPVVLLLPITLANQHGPWPRIFAAPNRPLQFLNMILHRGFEHWPLVKHGWNDSTLTTAIRRFCDRNDAFLLAKGRRKDPLRPAIVAMADKVLYDESYYPATILEAMSISNLCIHFYSTAVFESAFIGCYSLCIDRPAVDNTGEVPLYARMWRHGRAGHVYNYAGMSSWWRIPIAIGDLSHADLQDFVIDPRMRGAYMEKFLDYDDGRSSKRVLDAIQGLVNQ